MLTFFERGYFITEHMARQLSYRTALGVLPIILAQLSRLDFEILSVEKIFLGSEGEEVKDGSGNEAKKGEESNEILEGIRINIKVKDEEKKLIYIKCNLGNSNKKQITTLFNFVKKAPFITLIKSASYAFEDAAVFSGIRTFVLDNSSAILQDDTGIPFKFLRNRYKVTLFGHYEKPTLPVFKKNLQKDLAAAYKLSPNNPLPFKMGYGCLSDQSNLLLAVHSS
jgi:hypothetical protein